MTMSDKVIVGSIEVIRRHDGNIAIGSVHHSLVLCVQKNDIADLITALKTIQSEVDYARK